MQGSKQCRVGPPQSPSPLLTVTEYLCRKSRKGQVLAVLPLDRGNKSPCTLEGPFQAARWELHYQAVPHITMHFAADWTRTPIHSRFLSLSYGERQPFFSIDRHRLGQDTKKMILGMRRSQSLQQNLLLTNDMPNLPSLCILVYKTLLCLL